MLTTTVSLETSEVARLRNRTTRLHILHIACNSLQQNIPFKGAPGLVSTIPFLGSAPSPHLGRTGLVQSQSAQGCCLKAPMHRCSSLGVVEPVKMLEYHWLDFVQQPLSFVSHSILPLTRSSAQLLLVRVDK